MSVRLEYILPKFWTSVDLQGDVQAQARALAQRMTGGHTTDEAVKARAVLEGQLLSQFRNLAEATCELVLLEADPVAEVRTGTFLAVLPFRTQEGADPMDTLLAVASSHPGATVLEAGELVVLRTTEVQEVTEGVRKAIRESADLYQIAVSSLPEGAKVLVTELQYLVGDPSHPDDWFMVMGRIALRDDKESQDLAEALIGLCDSVVETMRFV